MAISQRCPNCDGQLHFGATDTLTTCEFCGAQARLDTTMPKPAASTGASIALGEAIAVVVSDDLTVPLLASGIALPAEYRQTIGSRDDQQESVTVNLVAGNEVTRPLLTVFVSLQKRQLRGMPVAQLTIEVDAAGAVRAEVREEGTTNSVTANGNVSVV